VEAGLNPPLFKRVLGRQFELLPPTLRALHSIVGSRLFHGECRIQRGAHPAVALLAWTAKLPPTSASAPTTVRFTSDHDGEIWLRDFDGHSMPSTLFQHRDSLRERLGAVVFQFALEVRDGEIHWRVQHVWLFGLLRLPGTWFAKVVCREREAAGRYEFLVQVDLPLIGPLIRYEGWLEPA
jgi:hypothetical protein